MSKVLNIIDVQHLYYKYKFTHLAGNLKELTYLDRDITLLYYPLREIELIAQMGEINTAICFNSKVNAYKEALDTMRENRMSSLKQSDFTNLAEIQEMLNAVGYSTYSIEDQEVNYMVASVCKKCYLSYNEIHIYTQDSNLLQLVCDKVTVHLYKQRKGYIEINKDNFEDIVSQLFKVYIPFNALGLYKAMCGDKSDKLNVIKGIKGFGPASFTSWVGKHPDLPYAHCTNPNHIWKILTTHFEGEKLEQALIALNKVALHTFDIEKMPQYTGTPSTRVEIYNQYGMQSLI